MSASLFPSKVVIPSQVRIPFVGYILVLMHEVVEITQILWRFHLIFDRRVHGLFLQLLPIKASEPRMFSDHLRTAFDYSESFGCFGLQQFRNEVLGLRRQISWIFELSLNDLAIRHHRLIVEKWRKRCEHLIDQNAESPPIHSFSVSLSRHNLRRQIIGRSA